MGMTTPALAGAMAWMLLGLGSSAHAATVSYSLDDAIAIAQSSPSPGASGNIELTVIAYFPGAETGTVAGIRGAIAFDCGSRKGTYTRLAYFDSNLKPTTLEDGIGPGTTFGPEEDPLYDYALRSLCHPEFAVARYLSTESADALFAAYREHPQRAPVLDIESRVAMEERMLARTAAGRHTLRCGEPTSLRELPIGQWVDASFDASDERHTWGRPHDRYRFQGEPGTRYRVETRTDGPGPAIEVMTRDGLQMVNVADNVGSIGNQRAWEQYTSHEHVELELATDCEYTVDVTGNQPNETGSYRIRITRH